MNATAEFDVFVSYNTLDHAPVERIGRALKELRLTVFLDRWELVAGRPWPAALEGHLGRCRSAAIALGPSGMGPWQQREVYLALDRQGRDASFGVIPVILPNADPALGFLKLNTWVDLRAAGVDDAAAMDLLAAAVRGEPPAALLDRTRQAVAQVCPYRGLEVFREEDAPFFFGREAFTEALRKAVANQAVVAVVGRSGSGKSSVVRAGLVPSLRRPEGDRVWEIVTLLPGAQPLQALAGALLPLLEPQMSEVDRLVEIQKLAQHLAKGDLGLHQVIKRVIEKQPGTDRLLLVVDQWEDLYTYARDKEARQASDRFIEELLAATSLAGAPLTVVLTLRADFYGEVLVNRPLSDRLQTAQVNLGPMTREELEWAVSQPAEKVGLTFETGLVERLLDDVGTEPGNLPLLEFALKELWSKRRGNLLLHATYQATGGVKRAIAERAQEIYESLDRAEKKTAERVFTRLVRPGDETGDTRRRVELRQLDAEAQALVRRLAGPEARLLTTGRDEGTRKETVEVAHEALIREWDLLRKWVEAVRTQPRTQDLMEELARGWKAHGGGLASGRQLRDFRRAGAPSALALEFLNASRARMLKVWASAGAAALVLLGGLGGFLWWSDDLGLSLKEGAELVLYRAGVHHPAWIPEEMVEIPAGSFLMGSAAADAADADPLADEDERPPHEVTFKQWFRLGKYEVTFEQYCASAKRPCPDDRSWGRGNQPVINASWEDANAYIDWLNGITGKTFRLPTEAEWEYAARGGTQGRYWWCEEQEPNCELIPDVENCSECESTRGLDGLGQRTLPVGSLAANPFGLYDIAGNVSEWVDDCYHDSYEGAPTDGSAWLEAGGGDCGRRVVRGGSWFDLPENLRSAYRQGGDADFRYGDLGFRLAQDPLP